MSGCQVGFSLRDVATTVSPPNAVVGETSVCDVEEQTESGVRKPVKVLNPQLPTQAEIDEHCLTRLPFRNWCQFCVKGVGRASDHQAHHREDGLPEVHMDYCSSARREKLKRPS